MHRIHVGDVNDVGCVCKELCVDADTSTLSRMCRVGATLAAL